MKIDDPYFD